MKTTWTTLILLSTMLSACTININNGGHSDDNNTNNLGVPPKPEVNKTEPEQKTLNTKKFKLPEKKGNTSTFTFKPNIQFTYTLPSAYRFMSQAQLKAIFQNGVKEINARTSNTMELWGIKKSDKDNVMISVDNASPGNQDEITPAFNTIKNTYLQRNIPFSSKRGFQVIGGIIFTKLNVTIYSDMTKSKALLYQDIYLAKYQGKMITINSNADDLISASIQNGMIKNADFKKSVLTRVN